MAVPQIPSSHICCFHILPPSPSLYLILTFIQKKKKISHGCSTSSFISNFLTTSSPQLIITSHFHLPLSHFHLLNSLTSSFSQLIVLLISNLNPMLGFFFSLHVVPMVLLLFEFQFQSAFFLLWFLIGFVGFHVFIYLFIWFFCFAQYFYFLAFFVPLVL